MTTPTDQPRPSPVASRRWAGIVGRFRHGGPGGQQALADALLANASDIATIVDADVRLRYVSPAAERVLGYRPGALVGRSPATLVHPEDRAVAEAQLRKLLANPGQLQSHQARYRHADGSWRWLEVVSTNRLADPQVGGLVSNSREVTSAGEVHELLRHKATHDPLTQLANRTLFAEKLSEALESRSGREAPYVSVLAVDIDDFTAINETFGRQAGDEALMALSDRLLSCLRGSDVAGRLGGDDFVALLPRTTAGEATLVAQRLLEMLRQPVLVGGRELTVSVSVGIAGSTGLTADSVLRAADTTMRYAKQTGKGRYAVYDNSTPDLGAGVERPGR
ncbi:sensor domain-containing diguanylate cyclase [Pilimelia columellifera]|uniref:Diguanylate cyclase n=1 Tax=Pilimelia columellifera subsp. columellifera TaxID=706583 RepID=A0ABP6A6T2_9ACTN